jgi:hypothetical protein
VTAPTVRTPCSEPTPCEGGEPCDRHETERAHAEGEHTFCGTECEVEYPSEQLRNFILAKGYPGTGRMLDELLRRAAAGQPRRRAPMAELSQEEAWEAGATRVPEEILDGIYETTNDGRPTGWPKLYDRTVEEWQETDERYGGDVVMMPGSGWTPMLRRDVQAFWGPLVTEDAYNEYMEAKNRRMALDYAAKAVASNV